MSRLLINKMAKMKFNRHKQSKTEFNLDSVKGVIKLTKAVKLEPFEVKSDTRK